MSDPGSIGQTSTSQNAIEVGQIGGNTIWPTLYNAQLTLEELSVDCDSTDKVAEAVLELYNIEYEDLSGASNGGDLDSMDIKRMDAMTILNWSLMERAAKSGREFIEPIMSPDGVVEFREIGTYNADIDDIYYEISTGSFVESPKAVMVTGARPLPEVRPMQWYPVWGTEAVKIYHQNDMLLNCRRDDYTRYSSIVFQDPQTTSTYNDGLENLYEINDLNPWDRISGYVNYIDPTSDATAETKITHTKNATIFIEIGNTGGTNPFMGTLVRRPVFNDLNTIGDAACLSPESGDEVDYNQGVVVDIDESLRFDTIREVRKDSFSKVSGVYVVGKKIDSLTIEPIDGPAQLNDPTIETTKSRFSISKTETTVMKLDEGKHFVVAYDGVIEPTPYIVFINNAHQKDPLLYGKDHKMFVNPLCTYAREMKIGKDEEQELTVYPHDRFQGIMVQQIWVSVDLNIPSISIYDPDGQGDRAIKIAQNLKYYISPIVITEEPAPIAYAGPSTGGSADLVDQLPPTDTDPTTAQDFEDREIDIYFDEMQGGGMSITFSFLDEDTVISMANMLYSHFQSDVVETVYTCGPDCNPILGGYGERGGVVNSIRYSYSDSSSYTVSVTEGPKLVGNLTPVDGGPSAKMSENFSSGGVIIDQLGDNIHFKVRIDGYGERWAVNMAPSVLRIGDVVSCTVHNNPVEA